MAAKSIPPRPVPRLYLATPVVDDPSSLIPGLPALLSADDVAAVLVRLAPTDQRTMIARIKALAPAIQNSGAALLIDGPVDGRPCRRRWRASCRHRAMQDALPTRNPIALPASAD